MHLRLLLILAMLAQQIALPAAIAASGGRPQTPACTTAGCCVVVQTTTCCGNVVDEMQCGKTGGACRCGVESHDPAPTPEAPRPSVRNELGPLFATAPCGVVAWPAPARVHPHAYAPVARPTHNETQALLCIWRT